MRFRSGIAGADTTVASGIDVDRDGAHSLQTTPRTNCGGTAGEEENVSDHFFLCLSRSVTQLPIPDATIQIPDIPLMRT